MRKGIDRFNGKLKLGEGKI